MTSAEKWEYVGDVNPAYGGIWIDLSTWNDGYCSAVRVCDLDSGCGFRGAVMVEHIVINGTDNPKRLRDAIRFAGVSHLRGCKKDGIRLFLAESLASYGHYDPDDSWDNYCSFHTEILQLEPDGPMKFDGWKADKRLRDADIKAYVESVHLR